PRLLTIIGNLLFHRFEDSGNIADLELAIKNLEYAVQLTPEGHEDLPHILSHFGVVLINRFKRLKKKEDIEQAIIYLWRSVKLTKDGDSSKTHRLIDLAHTFFTRFTHFGEPEDNRNAALYYGLAEQVTPHGHVDKPSFLAKLEHPFSTPLEHVEVTDIDQDIAIHERTLQLTPAGHPEMPTRLKILGDLSFRRFERLGETVDIDRAILNHDRAVKLTPIGHPERLKYLGNLGTSHLARFQRLEERQDIDQAVSNHMYTVQSLPDGHPDKPDWHTALGVSYLRRFEHFGAFADIQKAIANHHCAIGLVPVGHPNMLRYLSHLGSAFLARFHCLRYHADIEQAIVCHQHAAQFTPDDHPTRAGRLANLANSLSIRFSVTGNGADMFQAVMTFRWSSLSPNGPPSIRFDSAIQGARLAHQNCCNISSNMITLAYKTAFKLLPRMAWFGLSIDSRHHELFAARSLACDAVAAAIFLKNHRKALGWFELGRSIVWGQILQFQNPVKKLHAQNPLLAKNLMQVAVELGRDGADNIFYTGSKSDPLEPAAPKHPQLASKWAILVEEVRNLPGFDRFLLPKDDCELLNAARDGPVVVLNISKHACDALVIKSPSMVEYVSLHNFSYEKAQQLRDSVRAILSHRGLRDRYNGRHAEPVLPDGSNGDDAFRPILAELWNSVVVPVVLCLKSTLLTTMKDCVHIRWCPTGPLVFLPIHAAGIYNADGTSTACISDLAVSSYAPSLTALLNSFQPAVTKRPSFKILAVIQPNKSGRLSSLPGTVEELKRIQHHTSSIQKLEGPEATVEGVLTGMEECSWVHLACHGVQDMSRPMESGLLLHDRRLKLSDIIQKPLPNKDFAFLSACQTATGDHNRPEEAVHLAAGMLLAGYRGVVATMWCIRDEDAPLVTDSLYGYLLKDGQPSGVNPAAALHIAIRKLRERIGFEKFSSWVPFIYMG
ncbi:hypothetical protein BD410DRAFT_690373, partial [Rickenella mellea]